ncbi:hypothetical protein [Tianweitania sediminis]|jgi:hypothetical protein|uniref:Uncharacterized protein n=1 Tax=Tianweitania sediminis TaxID=1502156 RepID=A0A8J7R061_9HYPH|nr:hypothetical protein [Tianweitania sediminis]MBP0437590.1 hypothetical protein [Tianweitania sediminis]
MDLGLELDLMETAESEPSLPRPETPQRPQQAVEDAKSLGPLLEMVQAAASKIAFYERSFARLEETAERDARQAEADKRRLMERIEDLAALLRQSEANYEKTLQMLANSMQLCALQRMELRQMNELLAEARSSAFETTSYIKHLGLLVAGEQGRQSHS